jgi:hypothetical protein
VPRLPVRSPAPAFRFRSPHTFGTRTLGRITAVLLLGAVPLLPGAALGASHDGGPKVLLHSMAVAQKNLCGRGALADCRDADVAGTVGVPHFVYLLGTPGTGGTLSAVEVGVTYQDGEPNDRLDGAGIDIFSWTRCATLDFLSPAPRTWPAPAGGNLIVFDALLACQEGETAVFGYFYLTAYAPDALHLISRPQSGQAAIVDCSSVETTLEDADLGSVRFSNSGGESGCNPCGAPCPPAPELPPARCELLLTGTNFGTVTVGQASAPKTLTIRNTGGQRLDGTLAVDSPHFWILNGPREYIVEPYSETTRYVVLYPPGAGEFSTLLSGGSVCPDLLLTGVGAHQVDCRFTPVEMTLSGVAAGVDYDRTFRLTNHSAAPISGTVTLDPAGPPFLLLDDATFSLPPYGSRDFVVRFSPAEIGQFAVRLRAGPCSSALFQATTAGAVTPPECTVAASVLDFGEVPIGWTDSRNASISNTGGGAFLTDLRIEGTGFRHDDDAPTRLSIGPGVSWGLPIEFDPQEPGSFEGWLHFGGPCAPIRLTGVGRGPGAGVLEPESLDFGVVPPGAEAERAFTITNEGSDRIQGTLATSRPEFGIVGVATYSLAPGEVATFRVNFRPPKFGEYNGAVDAGAGSGVLPLWALSDEPTSIRPTTWSALKSRFRAP